MSGTHGSSERAIYEIRVKGHLGRHWAEWFEGLTMTHEANGETLLTGAVVDQAALHGVLARIRDLGLPLISMSEIEADQEEALKPEL